MCEECLRHFLVGVFVGGVLITAIIIFIWSILDR